MMAPTIREIITMTISNTMMTGIKSTVMIFFIRNRMILISHLSPLAPLVTEPKVSAESSSESLTLRP